MKKPKIVLLHYSSPPVVGGVEEVIKQQALLLHRQGHKVKVISGKGESLSRKFSTTIAPVFSSLNPHVDLALKELKAGKADRFKYVGDVIYEDLKREVNSYDILIVHNVMTMPYNLPLTYAVKKPSENHQIKIISWNHDSIYFYSDCPDMYHSDPWNILKERISSIHYVCISKFRCKQFQELYKINEEIPAIPDGIDPAGFFQLDPDSRKIIHEQKLYEADLIMVQPSRLIPRKNIELGLKVAGAMKRMGVDVRYLITGAYDPHEQRDVKYYRRLKETAKDLDIAGEVIFIAEYSTKNGKKIIPSHSFIRDLYFIADILFMPSSSEGFGLPLLEAGVIKLPIACSDIPPFLEIGGNYICTFSIIDSPDKIADKILQFLSTIPTHKMYRGIIKNYVWNSIYHKHLEPLFQKVITNQ
ncbi:MAG: glycosyltransferase family 4 protein [Thermodesulfobacteriota bacterium]|nr:glycosyltransferase family 4 protein [Thermodesulfobacteriota bacterium]